MKKGFCEECKAFHNWKMNAFHLSFPNGNSISTTFAVFSYSDNHDIDLKEIGKPDIRGYWDKPLASDTVEIMFNCPEKLKKKILKKYNEGDNDPIGYLGITEWLEIVTLLAKD